MHGLIIRLLTLAALALMPFGMQAASARPVQHGPAAGAAGHCDERDGQPAGHSPDRGIDCTMACSILTGAEAGVENPAPTLGLPPRRPLPERGAGLHPDTATPPPKLS